MIDLLKTLCELDGVSGNEQAVRQFILKEIDGFADTTVDACGNIIAQKKGKLPAKHRLMMDAHMDEVGLIVSSVDENGFLRFHTVGGISTSALLCRRVRIGECYGVIGCKPIHLAKGENDKKIPDADTLYIDIGAKSRAEALSAVNIGDTVAFDSGFTFMGEHTIKAKAIDDRAGVAVLIGLLKSDCLYDFTATFTVGEEVGLRGAQTVAYTVSPEFCLCLEATTAADLSGVATENRVCSLGDGVVVSFMDRGSIYDRELFCLATSSGVHYQTKQAVAGGNNAGKIHLSKGGVRTLALSLPCRYIHSPSCVADTHDLTDMAEMAQVLCEKICAGETL